MFMTTKCSSSPVEGTVANRQSLNNPAVHPGNEDWAHEQAPIDRP